MAAGIVWIIFVIGMVALAFYQASARNWLMISAVLLILVTPFTAVWLALVFWVVWLLLLIFRLATTLRRHYLVKPIMAWFLRVQPPLSQAERDVLESGNTWWEKEFFTGDPNWEKLLHHRQPTLTAEEQAFLDGPVGVFCAMLNDWQIEKENDLPSCAWDFIKQERLWGLSIPKRYGGLGFSALAHSAIIAKIASRSMNAAVSVMVPNALGPAIFIELFGTEPEKQYYLPRLARGEEISCFALTSSVAGSDAASIIDVGVVCYGTYEGEKVLGVCLNFDKRYITLAPIATLIGLAFYLRDPDHLLGSTVELGITCALLPAHLPGVESGARHQPMTAAFMNGPVRGKDVFIPIAKVVGGESGIGKGWRMLMECLSLGRGISLPSVATAINQLCFRATSAYVQVRHQFKRPIGDFEGVANSLAKIGGLAYLSEATRLLTVSAVDAGRKPSIASAIAKLHLTEFARLSVNMAMDIHGGRAIQQGPRNYLASLYNAIPICITVEGANILARNLIIFGQGLVRCHPYLSKEMQMISEPITKLHVQKFDALLLKHIGFSVSRFVRTVCYGLTGGRFIRSCRKGQLKYFLQQMTRLSAAFAFLTDVTLLLMGAQLKKRESLSARFGDIVSYLYMAAAVVQRYEQVQEREEEAPFIEWSLSYCLAKIQHSFEGILHNYPNKRLAWLLKRIIFPYGSVYHPPSDRCCAKVSALMQENSLLRDALTKHCYVGKPGDPLALVEAVFQHTESVEKILKSLSGLSGATDQAMLLQLERLSAQKAITQEDFALLDYFLQARIEANQVDEFKHKREINGPKNYYGDSHE